MDIAFGIALVILFLAGLVGVVYWFVLVTRFSSRLRIEHAAEYERLGSPSLFLNNTPRISQRLLDFLDTRAYRSLRDPDLTRLGDFMVPFLLIWKVGFLISVVCVLGLWASLRK